MAGKRVKIHTNFQLRKCAKRSFVGDDDDDRISQLPDEILVDILSLLPMKEAARTSVLSPRWINLWKLTPSLNFDVDQSLLDKFYYDEELLKSERPKYVKWVNSIIKSHESLTLKEFRIRFHLNKSSRKAITRWLQFAFSRQVQRLELDLKNYCGSSKYFCFPDELLTLSCSSESFCTGHRMVVGFKSLKALVFNRVFVSDGAIEFFLHNCPLLEQLIIHHSYKNLSKIEACGSSLKLKHLEIDCCPRLESLKVVSAPRITTLSVTTKYKTILIENVPMLVNVSMMCDDDDISIKHLFDVVLSRCISQLQALCMVLYSTDFGREISGEMDDLCGLPKMPNLKKLVVEYHARGHESLIRLAALMRVSPYLEEFELKFQWSRGRKDKEVRAPMRFPHHHLTVFKFCGYYGSANDVELLTCILENCVVLEKIIIDPYCLLFPELEQSARETAKQKLAPQVPPHVELAIL